MAQFSAKKIDTTTINSGQQVVNGSGVTPELFNAPVESALYTEKAIEVLTSTVDASEANNAEGTPTVSFSSKTEGGVEYKYLKFANLKGETGARGPQGVKGDKGDRGDRGLQGNVGEAAGFGNPTISVETLDEGSTATASVRATGDDTAKVFRFNFGLPKGDTGRGIETVVSDGNDLIIKYDDGEEVRLRGVIQTINALVADSRDDFEAAQIEENIGKIITYKGDLYLILGKNRTKILNYDTTDYNALSNTPVYIATSEESFNEYLQSYNVNKIVSYNGDLYTVVEVKNAPIEVDDTIDTLYFNTSLSDAEMLTNLSKLTYIIDKDSEYLPILGTSVDEWKLTIFKSSETEDYLLCVGGGNIDYVVYQSKDFSEEFGTEDTFVGWNTELIANNGAYSLGATETVTTVDQQDLWGAYISKEPFGGIEAKNVGGNEGTMDYNELENKPIIRVQNYSDIPTDLTEEYFGRFFYVESSRTLYYIDTVIAGGVDGSTTVVGYVKECNTYSGLNGRVPIELNDLTSVGLGSNRYVYHTGETTDQFEEGTIYYYNHSDQTYTPIKGGGTGSGITDVQVNGTSVVADGVASIPAAAYGNEGGILTSGTQSIKGYKKFDSIGIIYPNSNSSAVCGSITGTISNTIRITKNSYYGSIEIGGSNNTVATKNVVEVNSTDGICFINPPSVEKNVKAIRTFKGSTEKSAVLFSYDISGVVMATPESWSSGTTSSTILPSSGLYEIKITFDGVVHYTTINWDGKSETLSQSMSSISSGNDGTNYLTTRWFNVSNSGFVMLHMFNVNGWMTMDGFEFLYRKIAIA